MSLEHAVAIREMMAQFPYAWDVKDAEAIAQLFSDDAVHSRSSGNLEHWQGSPMILLTQGSVWSTDKRQSACRTKDLVKWLHHALEKASPWIFPSWASRSCKIAAVAR